MNDDENRSPFDDLFNLESSGSTFKDDNGEPIERQTKIASELINPETGNIIPRKVEAISLEDINVEERIDDLHIDEQLEKVYKASMNAFDQQSRLSQEVDPKFSARNAEVAAQYLNIALNSVNSRIDAKYKRNKVKIASANLNKNNEKTSTLVIADRNAVFDALFSKQTNVIDGTVETVLTNKDIDKEIKE